MGSRLEKVVNIGDLRERARRRLPKIAFDFIDGGVESELGMARNEAAFQAYRIVPRYLVDVSSRSMATTLFGQEYSMPFGISPTGGAGLYRKDADILLAKAAKSANIPFILSCGSTNSVASVAKHAGRNAWFQLYATKEQKYADGFVESARDAGVEVLVITVDVPVTPRRERNIRNGFKRPLRRTLPIILDGLMHPGWLAEYLASGGGMPMLENWAKFAGPGASADDVADIYASQTPSATQTWSQIETYRRNWSGKIVLKGILSPQDAVRAFDIGVDGVMVSNHGGRQLDSAPAALDMLPAIRRAVGPDRVVMMDSGVRRGSDILIALCLGADFVFAGRPTLFGVAAGGEAGARKALDILGTEFDVNMAQAGLCNVTDAKPDWLLRQDAGGLSRIVPQGAPTTT